LNRAGKKVCLVDLDVESQDLTRFLLVKPAINETLDLILNGQRAPAKEAVLECVRSIWDDVDGFSLVPPPSSDIFSSSDPQVALRGFQQVIETVRGLFDVVIIDGAQPAHTLRRLFAGATYRIIEVVTNDPAALPAAALRLSRAHGTVSEKSRVTVVVNAVDPSGLSPRDVEAGLGTVRGLPESVEFVANRYSKSGRAWPASGGTFWSSSSTVQSDLAPLTLDKQPNAVVAWSVLWSRVLAAVKKLVQQRWKGRASRLERSPLPTGVDRYLPSPKSASSGLISKPQLSEVPGSV
jgi:hypothetical protein